QSVGRARREMNSVIRGIGRFNAEHFLPAVGSHVGHAFGLVHPRIPDYRTVGPGFLYNDAAIPHRCNWPRCLIALESVSLVIRTSSMSCFLRLNPSVLSM